MKRSTTFSFVSLLILTVCMLVLSGCCHSLTYVHSAPEDPNRLWMAALKGIEGPVYYVGSEGDYSYFRSGTVACSRYKARTNKMSLPRTFPFGTEAPYQVTQGMVHYH